MAGVLSFDQYIGGADQIKIEQTFPKNQKTLIYNFGQDITGWTFELDYQTLVVDTVQFNRNTGQPNFSGSQVIGSFPKAEITDGNISVTDATNGLVKVTFPQNMYTGPIIPDARLNVPITIVALTWTDANTPVEIRTHRWALVQSWEPDVAVGDPTASTNPLYTAIGV
jgi:hypothetical protein